MWLWLLTQIAASKRCFPRNVCHGVAVPCNRTFPLLMYRDLLQGGFSGLTKLEGGCGWHPAKWQVIHEHLLSTFIFTLRKCPRPSIASLACILVGILALQQIPRHWRCWKGRITKPQSFHCMSSTHWVPRTLSGRLRLVCYIAWEDTMLWGPL